jgi:uncharacterized surface protein with fasciclin (FAS1) repeats
MIGVIGCKDDPDSIEPTGKDRFLDPPWLGGSSIDTLKNAGKYDIFLELMVKANYQESIEKQLYTLFVPDDDAFEEYFIKVGKTGVQDYSEKEAAQLFTLHVLPNARSAFQLKYEYYWEELQGPTGEYASLFFRKGTNSTVIPYTEHVKYNPTFKGRDLTVYAENKLLPLFSQSFFEDFYGAPDGSDYELIYPESKWAGNLNWHNAAVTDAEVRTSSGFIYFIDQVVGPVYSIEQYLNKNQDKFGVFYDLAQRFALYTNSQRRIEDNTLMYQKSYRLIEDIANELGPNPSLERFDRFKDIFSAFVPGDDVMQEYLDNNILKYYESLDSVPEITLYYIVQAHLIRSLALMSKIERNFFNAFGDVLEINREDIATGYMCSNGPVYTVNKVLEPNVFTTVPRRLFFDSQFNTFLLAMNSIELIPIISDLEFDITLFAVSNSEMEAANIRYNDNNDQVQTRGKDGIWKNMNPLDLIEFFFDHVYIGKLENLNGESYIQMSSGNYAYYNNGKIYSGRNQYLNEQASLIESETERNGNLHIIDKAIKTRYGFGEFIMNDPDLSEFAQLLINANMLNPYQVDPFTEDTIPNLTFIAESDSWTGFIPVNSAVQEAASSGLIPEDETELRNFLSYHFIRRNTIFSDGKKSGEFDSNSIFESSTQGIVYNKLSVSNSPNNLLVTDLSGNTTAIDQAHANNMVRRGVIHKTTAVLNFNQ